MTSHKALNYRVVGEGYPVIFLHGFLESSEMWNDLLPAFTKNFKCVLIDLPGHGKSPSIEKDKAQISSFAESIKEIIEQLSLRSFSIVGHSLGGYVSLALLEKIKIFEGKLILLNSHPWADSRTKKEERTRVIDVVKKNKRLFINTAIPNLFRTPENHKELVDALIREANEMETLDIELTLRAMRDRINRESVVKRLQKQSLVIQGKYDHLIPYEKMELFTTNNNIDFYLIEDAGHMSYAETREVVQKVIVNYLT